MKIAVTGTHGLVAQMLIPALKEGGHDVVGLVRGEPGPGEARWDPTRSTIDATALDGVEGVVHLAGASIAGRRWNDSYKRRILDSRVQGTSFLVAQLVRLPVRPKVLISASAVGFYGARGDEELTEESAGGQGFLADVSRQWELAAAPASEAGIRTVLIRTGIVQSARGGALKPQLPLFKLGLGAHLGDGRQWTSWIDIADEVGAIAHALDHGDLEGPVNLTAPAPVTNATYAKILGEVLGRPVFLTVPSPVLKMALGTEMAEQTLLVSQRALPAKLERSGYTFRQPDLKVALTAQLRR